MHMPGHLRRCKKLTDYQDLSGRFISFWKVGSEPRMHLGLTSLKSLLTLVLVLLRPITKTWKFFSPADVSFPQLPYFSGHPEKFYWSHLNQPDPKARVWGTAAVLCDRAGGADILRFTMSCKCKTSAALLMPYLAVLNAHHPRIYG